MSDFERGAIFYTDGSARPNPGYTGWGVHGFYYTTEPSKKGTGLKRYTITKMGYMLTDMLKTQPTADTPVVLFQPTDYVTMFGTSGDYSTNNAGELDAIINALESVINRYPEYPVSRVLVYTDSEYVRNGLKEWVKLWQANHWVTSTGKPVSNRDNWLRLLKVEKELENLSIELTIRHISAHVGHLGNEIADRLALLGTLHATHGKHTCVRNLDPAQGFWKNDIERHPYLCHRRMYFNTGKEFNQPGVYYLADGAGEFIFGKKASDAVYSVVKLAEPEPVVEIIRNRQMDISNEFNQVAYMRMDAVFAASGFPEAPYRVIQKYNEVPLISDRKRNFSINFLDDVALTVIQRSTDLSQRAVDQIQLLEEILDLFASIQDSKALPQQEGNYSFYDVTGSFYQFTQKQKKKEVLLECGLNPAFVVGYTDHKLELEIKGKTLTLPLSLGLDLPPRNSLKKLESANPKVVLVSWFESETSLRYACIIQSDYGLGIWSNYFANRVLIAG